MRLFFLPVALALFLGACAGAETPAQTVFAVKERYRVVLDLANRYEDLKRCNVPDAPIACSDPKAVDIIRKADLVADAALDEAEAVVRDPNASESALNLAVRSAEGAVATFASLVADLGLED